MTDCPLLMQAGLDSLAAVELRNSIATAFDVHVPVTLTYDYPTLAALAAFLVPQLAPAAPPAGFMSSVQVRLDDAERLHLTGRMAAGTTTFHSIGCFLPLGMGAAACFCTVLRRPVLGDCRVPIPRKLTL